MAEQNNNRKTSLEATVFHWILGIGVVSFVVVCVLLLYASVTLLVALTVLPLLAVAWLFVAYHVKHLLERHFHSLANVIESLRVGDFSMRVASQDADTAWSEVYREINLLASASQDRQLQHVESDILIDKLLAEFEVPVFVFDRSQVLRNINQMGCQLFDRTRDSLLGLNADQLQLNDLLENDSGSVIEHWFPNRGGRWELRRNHFIQNGQRYTLLLVNDLSRTLREEERTAWLRLIRVLGHELNNSLASLTSVSETLVQRLHDEKSEAWYSRYEKALALIQDRSRSLLRFTEAYTRLARLPKPDKHKTDLLALVTGLTDLIPGEVVIHNQSPVWIHADPDQLSQLLINLMKNAAEASEEGTPVEVSWQQYNQGIRLRVTDSGVGLPSSDNLFVPFYTTKDQGSGIGLFLCRQIAEAHDGTLRLYNREVANGCVAECWLPDSELRG